jgi:transposase-like protein
MMVSFKGVHFVKDIILTCVRWYAAYPLSYRQVEELMLVQCPLIVYTDMDPSLCKLLG